MHVFKAAVVGAGTMGGEIAQVIASSGLPVVLKDIKQELVDQGLAKAREVSETQIGALVKKGRLEQDAAEDKVEAIVGRIEGTTEYDGFSDVDFVIEAVPEQMEIKHAVLAEIDEATPSQAIISSNTSSLSISEMAEGTSRPDRVLGFHFFYPASQMKLLEIVTGRTTSEKTVNVATAFAQQIRKQPIRSTDSAGFVVNRVLMSGIASIWKVQHDEEIDPEAIDGAVMMAKVAPMGPFYLSDMLGLDTVLHVAENLHDSFGERFFLSPEMKELVDDGDLGLKTGKGFYEHGS